MQPPEPLTPEGKLRFADGILDPARQRIITVQEDHSGSGEAVNTISAICKQSTFSLKPPLKAPDLKVPAEMLGKYRFRPVAS